MDDWKSKLGNFVYSTNKETVSTNKIEEDEILPKNQELILKLEKKGRGGKTVVIIENFIGSENALKDLAKEIKNHCGTGGSIKDGAILIQGDVRDKIIVFLKNKAFKTKRVGG